MIVVDTIGSDMSTRKYTGALCQLVIVLALTAPAWAQHTELATNGDGSALYVASYSVLRSQSAVTTPETRLYRIGPGGVQFFARRQNIATNVGGSGDGIYSAQVSDDGKTVGFVESGVCETLPEPCVQYGYVVNIGGTRISLSGQGTLQLSRNGRWALLTPGITGTTGPPPPGDLLDLQTGQHTSVPAKRR